MSIIDTILNGDAPKKSLSHTITQTIIGELPILVVKHKNCTAALSLQGAHLLFWQPRTESTPVIWLSEKAIFKKGSAIRGGVPICWPWFSKLGDPTHGFARTADWQLASAKEDENGVDLVLSLTNNEQTNQFFSKPFSITLSIHLGKYCQMELSSLGDFEATSALHTYFGVDNINDVIIKGLGETYQDKLKTENIPTHIGQLTFNQEVDRIYTQPEPAVIIQDNQRTLKLTSLDANEIVTWNPWRESAKAMLDLDDDGYQSMVCVETARINQVMQLSLTEKSTYGFKVELI